MYAKNFTYDNVTLSSLGYVLCDFENGSDRGTGSEITFTTIPTDKGHKHLMVDYKYDNCLTTTLFICKNPCNVGDQANLVLSPTDVSSLMRWLNKKEFRPLYFDATNYTDILFNATFNVSAVYIGGEIYGLELEMITDMPFAQLAIVSTTLEFSYANQSLQLKDTSDEIGYIYPSVIVTCGASGELKLTNYLENRVTKITGCSQGEIIAMDYPTVTQLTVPPAEPFNHDLADCFNYVYFRIANTNATRFNVISCSMPARVQIIYRPIIKIVL